MVHMRGDGRHYGGDIMRVQRAPREREPFLLCVDFRRQVHPSVNSPVGFVFDFLRVGSYVNKKEPAQQLRERRTGT